MKLLIEWEIPDIPEQQPSKDATIYRSGLAAKMSMPPERRFDIHITGYHAKETHTICGLWLTTVDYANGDVDVKDQKRCESCVMLYEDMKRQRIRSRIAVLDEWFRNASLVHLIALVEKKAEEWGEKVEIEYERRTSERVEAGTSGTGIRESLHDGARDAKVRL